jgi:transcriptional regulator GlxA family with amidase domain
MAGSEGYSSLQAGRRCGRIAAMPAAPRQVVLVAYDGVQLLDLAGPLDVFDAATRALGVSSREPEAAMAEAAAAAPSEGGYELVVATPDGRDARTLAGPRLSAGARRTCSVCGGAFLLAAAGLLDGRRATTHWAGCALLASRFPAVSVHLARIFAERAGTTPGRFVERVRVEAARDLLEGGDGAVEEVARRCGFGSAETMRRGFLRVLGVGPAEYRRRFRTAELPPLTGAVAA